MEMIKKTCERDKKKRYEITMQVCAISQVDAAFKLLYLENADDSMILSDDENCYHGWLQLGKSVKHEFIGILNLIER